MSQLSDFYLGRSQLAAANRAIVEARSELRNAAASKWESPAARTYRQWYADAERQVIRTETELASVDRTSAVGLQCF